MKLWRKVRNILVLALMLAAVHATAVLAETTVSITGGENLQVGGPVAVTVTLQNDSAIEELDLFISYDSTLLQFVSGDGAEVQSDGRIRIRGDYDDSATQKIWTLQFNAVAAGTGSVGAQDVWVKDTEGNTDAGVTVNAGTVNISQTAVATVPTAAADPNAAQATADPAITGTAAGQDPALAALAQEIANDGTMSCLVGTEKWIVVEEFGNDILLPHFVETTQFYKGVEVTAGKLNNAEYYILLVRSEDGSQQKFVRYDQETKTFSDIIRLEQGENSVLYLINPAENAIPATFTETMYEGYRAWQLPASDLVDEFAANPSDFYLFYGYNQDGADGWFLFDSVTGGFTRYVETAPVAMSSTGAVAANGADASLSTRYNNLLSRFDFMVTCIKYVAIALIALLLILLIVNLSDKGDDNTKKKDKKKEKQEKKQAKKQAKKASQTEQKKAPAAETKKADAAPAKKADVPAKKAADVALAKKAATPAKKADVPVKKTADAASTKKAAAPAKKTGTPTKKADVPVKKTVAAASTKKAAAQAEKTDAVRETKKVDTVTPAEKTPAKKAAAAPSKKATAPAKKTVGKPAAVKADADGFIDDYVEEEDKAAPQNAQEEKAIGVLKPVAKTAETEKSIRDSIEELSRQIQETMNDEKTGVDVSELEELTFIDLDEN